MTTCPFCGASRAPADRTGTLWLPMWRCACGGVGVGASPMDIDEALDELEAALALARGTLGGPPPVPVGTSGMLHGTYIDPPVIAANAIAAAPPGWQVGTSRGAIDVETRPGETRSWALIVMWARRA